MRKTKVAIILPGFSQLSADRSLSLSATAGQPRPSAGVLAHAPSLLAHTISGTLVPTAVMLNEKHSSFAKCYMYSVC